MKMFFVRALRCCGAVVVAGLAVGCPDQSPAGPAEMSIDAGDAQTTVVGTPVSTAPSVRITNSTGSGVPSVPVHFTVADGSGKVTGESATTNENGVATVGSWTLGTKAGANLLKAESEALPAKQVVFTATARAATAASIAINAGNNQTLMPNVPVPIPPSVLVADKYGNPVSGTTVTFTSGSSSAFVTGGTQVTGADGIATVGSWRPTLAGANYLLATATGLTGSPVTFTMTGVIGPAYRLTGLNPVPSSTRSGVSFSPSIMVADSAGNQVKQSGVPVTATLTSGPGTLGGSAGATTNANGIAVFLGMTITGDAGNYTISFTTPGLATYAGKTTLSGDPAIIKVLAGDGQSAKVGTAVPTAPLVMITDSGGNPVANVGVTFMAFDGNGGGNESYVLTQSDGLATVPWTLKVVGSNTLRITAAGTSPVTLTATGTP